jgi:hypothetical protein
VANRWWIGGDVPEYCTVLDESSKKLTRISMEGVNLCFEEHSNPSIPNSCENKTVLSIKFLVKRILMETTRDRTGFEGRERGRERAETERHTHTHTHHHHTERERIEWLDV